MSAALSDPVPVLQGRDLNGDTVVDAFYDTVLDITWLRDANVNGAMDWNTAVAWADGYSFGGYSDWRLPTMGTCSINTGCSGALEMVQLWATLGGGTGDFQNLGGYYWSGTVLNESPDTAAWWFAYVTPYVGYYFTTKETPLFAMAVRDGDVAVVPEAGTYALMLAGLAMLRVLTRKRPH